MCKRDIYYNNIKSKIDWNKYNKSDKAVVAKYALKRVQRCHLAGHALSTDYIEYGKRFIDESVDDYNERLKICLFCSKYAYDFKHLKCFEPYLHVITDHYRLLTDEFKNSKKW